MTSNANTTNTSSNSNTAYDEIELYFSGDEVGSVNTVFGGIDVPVIPSTFDDVTAGMTTEEIAADVLDIPADEPAAEPTFVPAVSSSSSSSAGVLTGEEVSKKKKRVKKIAKKATRVDSDGSDDEEAPKKKKSKKVARSDSDDSDDEEAPKKKKSKKSKKAASDSNDSDNEDAPKKKSKKSKKVAADSDEEESPKKKKKARRDPNLPKSPLTAYQCFIRRTSEEFRTNSITNKTTKDFAEMWKALDKDARVPWQKLADEDRVRFESEMTAAGLEIPVKKGRGKKSVDASTQTE